TLLPLIVILMASLKTTEEFRTSGPLDPPGDWLNFANFVDAFVRGNMLQGFLNTTIILVFSLFGTILIGTMAAYAIDRFEFRFKSPFSAEWEVIAAGVIVIIVPTLIVFLVMQRFIYNGLVTGAVK